MMNFSKSFEHLFVFCYHCCCNAMLFSFICLWNWSSLFWVHLYQNGFCHVFGALGLPSYFSNTIGNFIVFFKHFEQNFIKYVGQGNWHLYDTWCSHAEAHIIPLVLTARLSVFSLVQCLSSEFHLHGSYPWNNLEYIHQWMYSW
jgi:hypothetical protein